MIVSLHELTAKIQSACMQVNMTEIHWRVELYSVLELMVNPLVNILVPQYTVLTVDEIAKLGVAASQMPQETVSYRVKFYKPLDKDSKKPEPSVLAKYLGLQDGQVVRIRRRNTSSMAGEHRLSYRVIVDITNQ